MGVHYGILVDKVPSSFQLARSCRAFPAHPPDSPQAPRCNAAIPAVARGRMHGLCATLLQEVNGPRLLFPHHSPLTGLGRLIRLEGRFNSLALEVCVYGHGLPYARPKRDGNAARSSQSGAEVCGHLRPPDGGARPGRHDQGCIR